LESTFIYSIITWIILIIVFFYQKNKIDALKTTIDAQKDILEAAKSLRELFNVKDYEDYIRMHKEKNKMEAEKLISDAQKEFSKKLNDRIVTAVDRTLEYNQKLINDLSLIIFSLLLRIPTDRRRDLSINNKFESDRTPELLNRIIDKTGEDFYPLISKNPSLGEIMYSMAMTK